MATNISRTVANDTADRLEVMEGMKRAASMHAITALAPNTVPI